MNEKSKFKTSHDAFKDSKESALSNKKIKHQGVEVKSQKTKKYPYKKQVDNRYQSDYTQHESNNIKDFATNNFSKDFGDKPNSKQIDFNSNISNDFAVEKHLQSFDNAPDSKTSTAKKNKLKGQSYDNFKTKDRYLNRDESVSKQLRHKENEFFKDTDLDGVIDTNDIDENNAQVSSIGEISDKTAKPIRQTRSRRKQKTARKFVNEKGNYLKPKNKVSNRSVDPDIKDSALSSKSNKAKGNAKKFDKAMNVEEAVPKKSKLKFSDEKVARKSFLSGSSKTVAPMASGLKRTVTEAKELDDYMEDVDGNYAVDASLKFSSKTGNSVRDVSSRVKNKVKLDRQTSKIKKLQMKSRHEKTKPTTIKKGRKSKLFQKKQIKKSYASKVRTDITTKLKQGLKAGVKLVAKLAQAVMQKFGLYALGIFAIIIIAIVLIQSTSTVIMAGLSAVSATSYQVEDIVVTKAEDEMKRLETELQYKINTIEDTYDTYDRYDYYVDNIGHNPFELLAYLTAKHGDFTTYEANSTIAGLFNEIYDYELKSVEETYVATVTVTDPVTGELSEEEEDRTRDVLEIYLTVNSLESVIQDKLDDEQKEIYDLVLETRGNFASCRSPFELDWKPYVSSMFSYRIDPIDGDVAFHTGLDLAKSEGTPLLAITEGKIIETGYNSIAGQYIVLEEESGFTFKYAHCSEIIADEDDEVKEGDIIAKLGNTGRSTGAHLHLEIKDADGNYLNPYFYLEE